MNLYDSHPAKPDYSSSPSVQPLDEKKPLASSTEAIISSENVTYAHSAPDKVLQNPVQPVADRCYVLKAECGQNSQVMILLQGLHFNFRNWRSHL